MKRFIWIIAVLVAVLLTGCQGELQDYTLQTQETEAVTTEKPTSLETEYREHHEYATYNDPVEDRGNGVNNLYYLTYLNAISYYDMELQREITLCSQPNCTHKDDHCVAYLGQQVVNGYKVRGDLVYAVVENETPEEEFLFIEQNMITGERRIIWDMTPMENMVREQIEFSLYKEVVFLTFREYERGWDVSGCSYEKNPMQYSYEIDLATGKRDLLLQDEIPVLSGFCFSGDAIVTEACTENYLVIRNKEFNEDALMTMEEYAKLYPQGDYGLYIWEEYEYTEHISLDRKTGETNRLCGSLKEAAMIDLNCMGAGKMFFAEDDTVCMYDGDTGQVTPCFTQTDVILLRYYDGRVWCNTRAEDETDAEFYWYDLQTGEKQQFQKGVSPMIFSINGETEDYFYGLGPGATRGISKQDFYNENYDAAF